MKRYYVAGLDTRRRIPAAVYVHGYSRKEARLKAKKLGVSPRKIKP